MRLNDAPKKTKRTIGYGQLAVGVILQAVSDLKKGLLIRANTNDPKQLRRANHEIAEAEKFLRNTNSPYHQILDVDARIFPEIVDKIIGEYMLNDV
jgi:hypothetical protein